MKTREAITWIQGHFPDFKPHDFRNALYKKHVTGKKPKGSGRLEFSEESLREYLDKHLTKRFGETTAKSVSRVKATAQKYNPEPQARSMGKNMTTLELRVNSMKLEIIDRAFSRQEIVGKLETIFDEIYSKVQTKLDELKGSL